MKQVYIAHPYGGDPANLDRARAWVRWANSILDREVDGGAAWAPWITPCEIYDDAETNQRDLWLRRDCALLARFDEMWLCGPRISEGMARELATFRGAVWRLPGEAPPPSDSEWWAPPGSWHVPEGWEPGE